MTRKYQLKLEHTVLISSKSIFVVWRQSISPSFRLNFVHKSMKNK